MSLSDLKIILYHFLAVIFERLFSQWGFLWILIVTCRALVAYSLKMHQNTFFFHVILHGNARTCGVVTHLKLLPETWFFFQVLLEAHS